MNHLNGMLSSYWYCTQL